MPHPWAVPLALLFASYGTALSLYTFISPLAAARLIGLDLEPPTISVSPPPGDLALRFVPLFGGRNLAVGLAILAFYWQRMPRAMGTVLICCAAAGVVDTVVMGVWGMAGKAWGHAVGTAVMGVTGWGLMG
ncbi:hypothetical protein MMC08_006131 [Hypocenomyce scalaris]|nr:hypothetical protein [Hypocenomyce scalaris]